MDTRSCGWCRGALGATVRRDAKFCSQRCRQASHRFGQGVVSAGRSRQKMRFAYADPPYPGLSKYYRGHPDYAGEVDHRALLSSLDGFDGWALSTSSRALPDILSLGVAAGLRLRVAAWVRGSRGGKSVWPSSSWEPVVFSGGRRDVSLHAACDDSLVFVSRARLTDPARVMGAKPAKFCYWLFSLLGALPGDDLVDMFPGSGGVSRAWSVFNLSCQDLGDASCGSGGHASCGPRGYASGGPGRDMSRVPAGDVLSVSVPEGAGGA